MFLHVTYLFFVYVSFPTLHSCFIFFSSADYMQKMPVVLWLNCFTILIYSFFSFKQEPNLLELSPYQTPIIQMMIKYISSFVNHLKKAVLLIRRSFLGLEEFVRQDIFILLRYICVCVCMNNCPCTVEVKVNVRYL